MALVRDDCLVPTLDAKELGYIRESSPQQYVPDVFYKVSRQSFPCLNGQYVMCYLISDQRRTWNRGYTGGPTFTPGISYH